MNARLRVLHLEDKVADTELVQATLEAEGIRSALTRVEAQHDFVAALEKGGFDVILADYTLPSFDGLSALKIAHERSPQIPFLFVSGTLGEDVAIEALKAGATDYVLKTRLSRLGPSLKRALREAERQMELNRAEAAARRSEKELRDLIATMPTMAFSTRADGSSEFVTPGWREYSGLSTEATAHPDWESTVHPDDLNLHRSKWQASLASGEPFENEVRHRSAR